jgi:hypothetical protein
VGSIALIVTCVALLSIPVAQAAAAESIEVSLAGSGSGEVKEVTAFSIGEPPIACEPTCESTTEFEYWALAAIPAEGSKFAGWSFSSGSPYFLCEEGFEEQEFVQELKEFFPEEFGKAEGACFASSATSVELVATFEEVDPILKVTILGSGTVVSDPAGIECIGEGKGATVCEGFALGLITLIASPAPGYLFKGWKKCDTGGVNGRRCTINSSGAREIEAIFIPVWDLTISKAAGSGPGIAQTKPGGILCPYACTSATAIYREGQEVEVTTKPAKRFHFVEYLNGTGSASVCNGKDGAEGCSFTISANSSIEELYEEDEKSTLSLSKEGGGQGFVKTKPTNVNCGYTCTSAEAEFFAAETVPVSIKLNKGTTKLTWVSGAGTCTGTVETTESTCTIPMSASHALVARFE